ncbi:MAG: MurR/RpiR family transcriptional regulator [Clostridia bacterium]|nr:MurR/RpiR family transcriptional regulator [Clostridia bacterium]
MSVNLINQIKSNIDFLTTAERKIAQIILDDPAKFSGYSMTELSLKADVSQGTIINFSKKFAGGGYPALKRLAAECCNSTKNQDDGTVRFTHSALIKTALDCEESFGLTVDVNSEDTLHEVAAKIASAKKVEIYGIFRSAAVATDFYYQLIEIGIPASFVSDILTCAISASMLDEESLVIAVSSSGRTKDVIDAVKNAKANGVPVVCITSNKNSPLAKISDYVLVACSATRSETEIRASQLLLTDAICSLLRSDMDDDDRRKHLKLKEILNSHSVND